MKKFTLSLCLWLTMALPALAADSTSLFNEKVLGTKIEKASGGGGVPVGTVIAWPSNSNPEDPENWLECNGQGISHSVYPELFAVVGGAVPDLREVFLRGGATPSMTKVPEKMGTHMHEIQGWSKIVHAFSIAGGYHSSPGGSHVGGNVYEGGDGSAFTWTWVPIPGAEASVTGEGYPAHMRVRYLIRAKP